MKLPLRTHFSVTGHTSSIDDNICSNIFKWLKLKEKIPFALQNKRLPQETPFRIQIDEYFKMKVLFLFETNPHQQIKGITNKICRTNIITNDPLVIPHLFFVSCIAGKM